MKIMKRVIYLILFFPLYLFPQQSTISKAVNYLSDFIASDYFLKLKKENSDIALVDSIYLRAVEFYEYDYNEALLALTFATIPYKEVPIVIPLTKIIVYYPLVSADDSTFNKKNQNLPNKLFYDTPENDYGDKDKLAHFFGNAYIGYAENVFDLAVPFGYFVEAFEEDFKVQSKIDMRDLDVNNYGRIFGESMEENRSILPSEIILIRSLRYSIFIL
jgi:hypothetical protein